MGYIINMPKLEQGMQEGLLADWLVDVGDQVEEGQAIVEIESEKTVSEIEAQESGVLRRKIVEVGDSVPPGTPLGIVAEKDADIEALEREAGIFEDEKKPEASPETGGSKEAIPEGTPDEADSSSTRASPKARKRANELGVKIGSIAGSGPGDAVTVSDVESAAESAVEISATSKAESRSQELGVDLDTVEGSGPRGVVTVGDVEAVSSESGGIRERRELTGMRRTIADRLGKSYREAVHVTVTRTAPVEELIAATSVADQHLDCDVSITDLVLLAVSATLSDHPEFNATFSDDVHEIYHHQHIGVAVDVERGLLTPVIDNVDSKSLSEIAEERQSLTRAVLASEHSAGDISGGTFTVTNLGVFGVDSFTPIINPPQVAILAVDRIREQPIRKGDDIEFQKHIGFDLSFDHRVVDGADAARFLESLAGHVENPWSLLLERT